MKFEVNGNEFKVCMSLFEFGMRFADYKKINKPFKDVSINYDNDNLVIVKFDTECHGLSREILEAKCTEEEINLVDSYIDEWRNMDDAYDEAREDTFSEEFYWRKPYGLHQFITQKFLNVGEDDNCVHIPLSKENIETIINELKTNPTFFEKNVMWDSNDTEYAIGVFTRLLNEYSDDVVITYYAWY